MSVPTAGSTPTPFDAAAALTWVRHETACQPSGWWDEIGFHETDDTGFLLAQLEQLWLHVPRYNPLSVVLLGLVPAPSPKRRAMLRRPVIGPRYRSG